MGLWILYDPEKGRAVLYDSTQERAVPAPSFFGVEEAEDFIEWCGVDPRSMTKANLEVAVNEWRAVAFNEEDEFVGATAGVAAEPTESGHWCFVLRAFRRPGIDACPVCGAEYPPIGEPQPEPVWKRD